MLRVNLFSAITAYAFEPILQDELLNIENFCTVILNSLKSSATIVKTAVSEFLIITGKLKKFSDRYIEDGVLEQYTINFLCPFSY